MPESCRGFWSLLTTCFAAGEKETNRKSSSGPYVIDGVQSIYVLFSILDVKEC